MNPIEYTIGQAWPSLAYPGVRVLVKLVDPMFRCFFCAPPIFQRLRQSPARASSPPDDFRIVDGWVFFDFTSLKADQPIHAQELDTYLAQACKAIDELSLPTFQTANDTLKEIDHLEADESLSNAIASSLQKLDNAALETVFGEGWQQHWQTPYDTPVSTHMETGFKFKREPGGCVFDESDLLFPIETATRQRLHAQAHFLSSMLDAKQRPPAPPKHWFA